MSGFPILDLVAGMIFIYFMLSIICSSAVEIILSVRKLRARMLEKWLYRIFDKKVVIGGETVSLGQAIMDHCSVTALSPKGRSTAYIHAKDFTSALLEKITYDPDKPTSIAKDLDTFINHIESSPSLSNELKRVFLGYANEVKDTYRTAGAKAVGELEMFRGKIENWFDSSMERVGGAFKHKYMRFWTFIVATTVSILMNADSIAVAKYLYNNPEARAKLSDQAFVAVKDSSLQRSLDKLKQSQAFNATDSVSLEQIEANIKDRVADIRTAENSLQDDLPLGWNDRVFNDTSGRFSGWLVLGKILGLAATILAIMMGSPFWFDVLNKVSNLRGSGKKPAEAVTVSPAALPAAPAAPPITVNVHTKPEEEAVG
jgi:hypothetical protein